MLEKANIIILNYIAKDHIWLYCIVKLNMIVLIIILYIGWCKSLFFYSKMKPFYNFNLASQG